MKILQINKFFYIRGGSSRYFFELSELLQSRGHQLAYFSMQDSNNQKSEWSNYFVNNISYEKVEMKDAIKKVLNMIYSFEARRKISKLFDEFHPDIAHLHSIYHHLSPSTIYELAKRNIPIVQTLHDYHIISPNHTLFHDGKICEVTKKRKFYKAILHKCIKRSRLAGILEVIEQYIDMFLGVNTRVDIFISPSNFHAKKLIEYGIPQEKIEVLHNFCDCRKFKPHYESGKYILYFGRLSSEKGLDFLINTMSHLSNIKLKIAGTGSEECKLQTLVKSLKIRNIKFEGHKSGEGLKRLIYGSRFTVLPSKCYEIFPISVLEAFASGKPVVASNIGGIPELVKDGLSGFLFEPGNIDDCKDKILKLWNNPSLCIKLGKNAREYVEKNFGPQDHYEKLLAFYKKVISKYQ